MRTVQEIKDKREKLRNDIAIIENKYRELFQENLKETDNEIKKMRWKEMSNLSKNKELIYGQIEALTYMLNLDYEMTRLNEDLTMSRLVSVIGKERCK